MKNILFLFSSMFCFCMCVTKSYSQESLLTNNAVILVYHHVSTATPASTSVTPEQFRKHMEYLNAHFHIEKLTVIIEKLKANLPLQPNTVAVTFDDGYKNILENAHPILKELKAPYTIFINPNRIGKEKGQLSWSQVQAMQNQGVTFANHTLDHIHLLDRLENETQNQWLNRVWDNISAAQTQLEQKLGKTPKWLAYPFGEYNAQLANKLKAEGFIGFAQHSGAISSGSDFSALPRFPAAGRYANLNTLKVKMASLAMPVTNVTPTDPEQTLGNYIAFSFILGQTEQQNDVSVSQLRCFYKGDVIDHSTEKSAKEGTVIKVTSDIPVPVGRSRVNCTAPSNRLSNRYYWYSQPFFLSNTQGKYPN